MQKSTKSDVPENEPLFVWLPKAFGRNSFCVLFIDQNELRIIELEKQFGLFDSLEKNLKISKNGVSPIPNGINYKINLSKIRKIIVNQDSLWARVWFGMIIRIDIEKTDNSIIKTGFNLSFYDDFSKKDFQSLLNYLKKSNKPVEIIPQGLLKRWMFVSPYAEWK